MSKFTLAATLAVALAAAATPLHADIITLSANDCGITNAGAIEDTSYAVRIGEFYAPGGETYVMPLLLPSLPAGQQFSAVNLRMELFGIAGAPGNLDLYGLTRVAPTDTVLPEDYYQGSLDPSNTLLQANIVTPTMTIGANFNTSPDADTALADFLNTQYADGANAGQYAFLRFTYDVDPIPNGNNAYTLLTQDAGGATEKPLLTYTPAAATPEPASLATLALGALALLPRRRRA